jgi:hypothetical protein
MPLIPDNFPERVWARLKAWAQSISECQENPTFDQCAAQVERIVADVTGVPNLLRPDVVEFYANETLEMIARFRDELGEAAV